MPNALLIDADFAHAELLMRQLGSRHLRVSFANDTEEAISALRNRMSHFDLVIINISDTTQPWLAILDRLQEVCYRSGTNSSPLFLCVSTHKRETNFQLQIEHRGARYVHER